MNARPLNVLLLCNRTGPSVDATTVTDHLNAFGLYSRHRVRELSFLRELPVALDLAQFDVVVIHYTIAIGWLSEHYLSPASKLKLREFSGLKCLFIQDEYRAVNTLRDALRFMEVDILFTLVSDAEMEKVYPSETLPGLIKVNNLAGYVPEALVGVEALPIAQRPIDVGYRTRKPPYWLGALAYEKWRISERFIVHAAGTGLKLDLSYSEEDRLYGSAWTRFVSNCKSMLGVESGSSVCDFTGEIQQKVEAHEKAHPETSFEEVRDLYFRDVDGKVMMNIISPRCFEAAALRTSMVLYEGAYSGALTPWRHFLPLRKDFANFPEILDALRDTRKLQDVADCAYEEIAKSGIYSYRAFIARFDDIVAQEFERRGKRPSGVPFSRTNYASQLLRSPSYLAHRAYSRVFQWLLLGPSRRRVMMKLWYSIPVQVREFVGRCSDGYWGGEVKILSIVGARPQFVKAAVVSKALAARAGVREVLVHTGQHFDASMSDVFFRELAIPAPAHHLGIGGLSHGAMTGRMLEALEPVMQREQPDRVLVYGDTNSTLAGALAAAKLKLPVAHVEAGLRSFNRAMPEEINRVVTDHLSSLLFAPTAQAVENLRREGIAADAIVRTGDVMYDAALTFGGTGAKGKDVLAAHGLASKGYILATVHRAENTDDPARLRTLFQALAETSARHPVVLPLHPRTRKLLVDLGLPMPESLRMIEPVGFLEMMALEMHALAIATDSGGVQKEAYFHRVPCVTLREETEWVELIEAGANRLAPPHDANAIVRAIEAALATPASVFGGELYGKGDAAEQIALRLAR